MSVSFYENIVKHIQLTHSLRSIIARTVQTCPGHASVCVGVVLTQGCMSLWKHKAVQNGTRVFGKYN